MSHKIDERKENIQKIKKDIERTQLNVEAANDMLETINDPVIRNKIKNQNDHRQEAIDEKIQDVTRRITD